MRDVTAWFVLLAPPIILLTDWLVYFRYGYSHTITAVVRRWHDESIWTEVIFVVGVVVLWAHLFRRFP